MDHGYYRAALKREAQNELRCQASVDLEAAVTELEAALKLHRGKRPRLEVPKIPEFPQVPELKCSEAEELKNKRRFAERPLWRGEHDVRLTHFKTGFHICLAHNGGNFVHSLLPLGGAPSPAEAAGVKVNDVILSFDDRDVISSSLAELCALFKAVPVGESVKVRLMRSPAWYVPEKQLTERHELTKAIKLRFFGKLLEARAQKNAACYERLLFLDAASFEEYREEGTLWKRMRPICAAVKRQDLEFDRKDLEADRAALVAYRARLGNN